MVHAQMTQLPQLLDELLLHGIGGQQRPVGGTGQLQNDFKPRQQFRVLAQPLDELLFRRVQLVSAFSFVLHPHFIEPTVVICTLYSKEILPPLTRF